jgi:hypothetical protein
MIALAICRVADSRATTFVGLRGSGLPVSPAEKSAARYTKAASTMWHTTTVCTRTDTHEACKQSADKVQTKCRVVYTAFCIEYQ